MTAFFRSIVDKIKGAPAAPQIHLAAFGKHPGWNDHLDDQGLETDRLIAIKRLLYVQGIGANIDAGAWDKLDPAQRLDGFKHAFLWWNGPADITLGRFWASRDGKGRDKYPMVVAAQCLGVPLGWVLKNVATILEQTQAKSVAAATAAEVIAALDADRAALRALLPAAAAVDEPLAPARVAELAECPAFAAAPEGFARILYQIARSLAPYFPGPKTARTPRPEHLRVPRCAAQTDPLDAAALWLGFLLTQLDPASSILMLVPLEHPFVDILVGEPTVAQIFNARAAPAAAPLTSDIPYTLDETFLAATRQFIATCRSAPAAIPAAPRP